MRFAFVLAAAFALLVPILLPQAAGQTGESAGLVADPVGDVRAYADGAPLQAVATADVVDLVGIDIVESPTDFLVEVSFAMVDEGPRVDATMVLVRFVHDGMEFGVRAFRPADSNSWTGELLAKAAGDPGFHFLVSLPIFTDAQEDLVWTTVARSDLVGFSGKVPGRGDKLLNISAQSSAHNLKWGPLAVQDFAPDTGGADLEVLFGGAVASGSLGLSAAEPFRASNGGDEQLTFMVTASNRGPDAKLRLSTQDVPAGWQVLLPGEVFELAAGRSAEFPVILRTVFAHEHGTARHFELHLHDTMTNSTCTTT